MAWYLCLNFKVMMANIEKATSTQALESGKTNAGRERGLGHLLIGWFVYTMLALGAKASVGCPNNPPRNSLLLYFRALLYVLCTCYGTGPPLSISSPLSSELLQACLVGGSDGIAEYGRKQPSHRWRRYLPQRKPNISVRNESFLTVT